MKAENCEAIPRAYFLSAFAIVSSTVAPRIGLLSPTRSVTASVGYLPFSVVSSFSAAFVVTTSNDCGRTQETVIRLEMSPLSNRLPNFCFINFTLSMLIPLTRSLGVSFVQNTPMSPRIMVFLLYHKTFTIAIVKKCSNDRNSINKLVHFIHKFELFRCA